MISEFAHYVFLYYVKDDLKGNKNEDYLAALQYLLIQVSHGTLEHKYRLIEALLVAEDDLFYVEFTESRYIENGIQIIQDMIYDYVDDVLTIKETNKLLKYINT